MEIETWKAIAGCAELEGFAEVSDRGRVRTLDRLAKSAREHQPTQLRRGGVISPWVGKNGYAYVQIKRDGRRRKFAVHRLAALAFVPGHFDGATVDHIDGDKLNNLPANLQWVTLARNTALQWQTGLIDIRGEKHPSAKLTDADVRAIRAARADGERVAELAERFGVSTALIYMIASGRKRAAA